MTNTIPNAGIIDDKSPLCIPFIRSLLPPPTITAHTKPFIIGLNGIQGAGKTTLVTSLQSDLSDLGLPTLVLSIDDLYLTHSDQTAFAATNPQNPLIQHRGEPGTHDLVLASQIFEALKEGREVKIPQYDKAANGGAGDRVPVEKWKTVNAEGEPKIRVIIFEGWCVGFRSLPQEEVLKKQRLPSKTLATHRIEDLLFVNEMLKEYEVLNEAFDAFIHINAEETEWVYEWREEQEVKLRETGRGGMSSEQVKKFVDGYFPAYELFGDALREGIFKGREGMQAKQLTLVVGRDRRVKEVRRI